MTNKLDMKKVKVALERKVAQTYEPVKPAMQFGFIHNNVDCIGCRACEIACKDKNGLPPGPRFRRVMYVEGGTYPDVFAYKVNMSCNHLPDGCDLETEQGRHRRHRFILVHRLSQMRGVVPLWRAPVESEGADHPEMQYVCG